ncbi:UV DNA damage repair endonuclease UvsE [Pseudonocardia broussonetiae]|uniref:UV DNA damage repair endonuclease UvsE n=1 Tax=Pseudonocardia broussonetiae TaxID=2736640 RepID=A0A6M6JJU5_9PSEU|nr:UV DNA damage repair endonuclease UvsE [Pseudonocardia broussonetiae]QJY47433.1 UV DNA damage repair endonuclease UvsE [Pseudonocardia broussonetiae]
MKLGYPAINQALACRCSGTFRLASFSEERMTETITANLACLRRVLAWNTEHRLMFFRITSNLVPFASHPVSAGYDWRGRFAGELADIGAYVRAHGVRISLHPGQFVVLNSPSEATYASSVAELVYHAELLDALGLDRTHKVQIHLGGRHGDAERSMEVFAERYAALPEAVRERLVIENDERDASLAECLRLHAAVGVPVLFDTLHHSIRNDGETELRGLDLAAATWGPADGTPMVDYSTQDPARRPGAHAVTLDVEHFRSFVRRLRRRDVDVMLEIKNKEASALQARVVLDELGTVER